MNFFTSLLGPVCHICCRAIAFRESLCGDCLREMSSLAGSLLPPEHDLPPHVAAACRYEGWTKKLVLSQKQNPHPLLVDWMACRLVDFCPPSWRLRPVVWVPPRPLSAPHLVEALARALQHRGFQPLPATPLRRALFSRGAWRQQKHRTKLQRRFASPSVYECKPLSSELRGANILVLDDIITTGSTIQASIDALKNAGAGHVAALAFAATPRR